MTQHVDVLIIGAGLSGIGAACHLIREQTGSTYAILERRENIGGTWDLFKYPGIRSDSDMLTFGFGFRPWIGTKVLADGASIRDYVEETAKEYGVTDHINFGRKVVAMDFDRATAQWSVTVLVEATGETETWTANVLVGACVTTTTTRDTAPPSPVRTTSVVRSCTRSTGRRISITPERR